MTFEIRMRQRIKCPLDKSSLKVAIFERERERESAVSDGTARKPMRGLHFGEGTYLSTA